MTSKIQISKRALIQRINRKLLPNAMLKATRGVARQMHGEYFVVNINGQVVITKADPATLARDLGVLRTYESIEEKKGHGPSQHLPP